MPCIAEAPEPLDFKPDLQDVLRHLLLPTGCLNTGNVLSTTEATGMEGSTETFFSSHAFEVDWPLKPLVLCVHSTGNTLAGLIQVTKKATPPAEALQSKAEGWSFSIVHTVMLMHTGSFLWSGLWFVSGTSSLLI